MEIIINTDSNIEGTEEMRTRLGVTIATALDRFSKHLTRIEVKLSDEDGDKNSENDKRCVLEARLKGMQPLVVTGSGHSVDNAVDAAIGKMRSSLDSMKGRLKDF